jgi:hypothetical protein
MTGDEIIKLLSDFSTKMPKNDMVENIISEITSLILTNKINFEHYENRRTIERALKRLSDYLTNPDDISSIIDDLFLMEIDGINEINVEHTIYLLTDLRDAITNNDNEDADINDSSSSAKPNSACEDMIAFRDNNGFFSLTAYHDYSSGCTTSASTNQKDSYQTDRRANIRDTTVNFNSNFRSLNSDYSCEQFQSRDFGDIDITIAECELLSPFKNEGKVLESPEFDRSTAAPLSDIFGINTQHNTQTSIKNRIELIDKLKSIIKISESADDFTADEYTADIAARIIFLITSLQYTESQSPYTICNQDLIFTTLNEIMFCFQDQESLMTFLSCEPTNFDFIIGMLNILAEASGITEETIMIVEESFREIEDRFENRLEMALFLLNNPINFEPALSGQDIQHKANNSLSSRMFIDTDFDLSTSDTSGEFNSQSSVTMNSPSNHSDRLFFGLLEYPDYPHIH